MTEEPNGKASVKDVYEAVNSLRAELNEQFKQLREELTSSFATRDACRTRHEAIEQATNLRAERLATAEKKIDDLRVFMYKAIGAGMAIAAIASFILDRLFR